MTTAGAAAPASPPIRASEALQKKLAKIGLHREADLLVHLPLRYEDETRITPVARAPWGEPVQVEVVVSSCEVQFRPRRQMVVRALDASGELVMRFFSFYPSQQGALSEGSRVRAFGEVRGGFFGAEMVHPRFRKVGDAEPLPSELTPIYPSTAGLANSALQKLIGKALDRIGEQLATRLGVAALAIAIEEAGQTRVLANLARTKQTPEALASWHASADPADIIAEGIGPRGVRQLGTANRHGYQTDDIVTALDSRAADEGARFANVIEKAGGKTARDAATVKQEAFDAIATKRNKLYNKAYQRPDVDAPEVAQVAAELAQMKDGRAALQRASDLAVGKNQLQDWESGSSKISVANLHNLREGIDHAIDVAQAHGDDQMVRALSMRRSVVDNAFKNAGGKAARQADKLHQQAAQLGESFAAGEKLAQGAIPQARNAEGIAAFASNASDPDAFAHGIVSDFATRAASTPSGVGGQPQNPAKIVNSGLAQLRLRQGLPDDQAMTTVMDAARGATNRMKTRVKVLGNSDTAERLADDAMEVGAPIKQLTAATRNPVSAALNYAGSGLDALRRRATGAELDEAAKILMAGAPGQMSRADAIQMLQAAGPRISRKMLTRGNVRGLIGGTTGNALLDALNR